MTHETNSHFVVQLLQLRPHALRTFERVAATGLVEAVYYDLTAKETPALFVVINRSGDEVTEIIPLDYPE